MATPSSPSQVLSDRNRLLATLVEAYLVQQDDFREWSPGDDDKWLFHPALPGGHIIPNWSHVYALAREALLVREPERQPGAFRISLGSSVLRGLDSASSVQPADTTELRRATAEQIVINVTGGSANIAVQSSHFTQTVTNEVKAGDVQGLLDALGSLGIHESHRAELESALSDEADLAGRGARARRWFGDYLSRAASGATGTGLYAAAGQWPSIQQAIEAFVGVG